MEEVILEVGEVGEPQPLHGNVGIGEVTSRRNNSVQIRNTRRREWHRGGLAHRRTTGARVGVCPHLLLVEEPGCVGSQFSGGSIKKTDRGT